MKIFLNKAIIIIRFKCLNIDYYLNLKFFCEKKTLSTVPGFEPGSFDCRSTAITNWPYTSVRHLLLHRKTSLYRLAALPYGCNNFKLGGTLEQSADNRKTRARIPAQSNASPFPQKNVKFFEFEFNLHYCDIRVRNCIRRHVSATCPIWYATNDPPIM